MPQRRTHTVLDITITTKCQRRVDRVHAVMTPDAAVSIRRIRVRVHSALSLEDSLYVKRFAGVGDASEHSASTISDGFSSIRVRNRPPLPQSNSVPASKQCIVQSWSRRVLNLSIDLLLATRHDDVHVPKLMRTWLQHTQSQTEVNATNGLDPGG